LVLDDGWSGCRLIFYGGVIGGRLVGKFGEAVVVASIEMGGFIIFFGWNGWDGEAQVLTDRS
jgi:hypothetical protein